MALVRPSSQSGIGMTSLRTRDRMLTRLREQGIKDEIVLSAISSIPRHIFVDEALSIRAYEDVSLPIGFGQTISQPYIVARMSEILRNGKPLNKRKDIIIERLMQLDKEITELYQHYHNNKWLHAYGESNYPIIKKYNEIYP